MADKVCVEIGKNIIKIAQGSFSKRLFIKKYFEVVAEEQIIIDDMKVDGIVLHKYLNKCITDNNFSKKNITIVLTGLSNMLIREMTLPYLNEQKTFSMIGIETRQFLPIAIDNYIVDYKQLEVFNEGKTKKQKVMVVAVPKNVIEQIINAANRIKLKIDKIDIEANSITKLVALEREVRKENKDVYMIVNIMRSFFTAVIARGKRIIIAKTFPNGDLERMFVENYGYDTELSSTYSYAINDIVNSIAKFYDFYKNREQDLANLSKVYLTGEVCQHIDISDMLKEKMGLEVELLTNLNLIENKVMLNKADFCGYSTAFSGLL